jgi:hypothetical protein
MHGLSFALAPGRICGAGTVVFRGYAGWLVTTPLASFPGLNGESQENSVQHCQTHCGEEGSQGCEKARAFQPMVAHAQRCCAVSCRADGGQQHAAWLRSDWHRSILRLCGSRGVEFKLRRTLEGRRIEIGAMLWYYVPILILHELLPGCP